MELRIWDSFSCLVNCIFIFYSSLDRFYLCEKTLLAKWYEPVIKGFEYAKTMVC